MSALAAAAVAAGSLPAQAVTINGFGPGILAGSPLGQIVAGREGDLWFTAPRFPAAGSVARMTPGGVLSVFPAGQGTDESIGPIALGPDGDLWFTGSNGGGGVTLARIDPRGTVTAFESVLGQSGAPEITPGPQSTMWLGISSGRDANSRGELLRIAATGAQARFAYPAAPGCSTCTRNRIGGIAPGSEGAVWFTDSASHEGGSEEGLVGRVTLEGQVALFSTGARFDGPSGYHVGGIVAGPEGDMWFTDSEGRIERVTPGGTVTEVAALTVAPAPPEGTVDEIAAGPDGNLWVTEPSSEEIARITPQGAVTQFSEAITGEPVSIASGPNDTLWFTERDGALGQVVFPPVVSTVSARAGGRGAATLTGTVNPFGQAVTACRFEYGTSSMYGSSVPCGSLPAAGEHSVCVSAPVFGLAAHTTYHFRIVATTAGGTSYGLDLEFTTASALAGHLPPLGHQPRRPSEWRWSLRHRWQPRAG